MKQYFYEDFHFVLIVKITLFKRDKLYYTYKEDAVSEARRLVRQGYWVKVKALNESDNS